ncbi:MAG: hypothetical protein L3K16_01840 [Thermoplasmata archaeon]|nr:hypothetical protein [Thermoplasmata archaeon]
MTDRAPTGTGRDVRDRLREAESTLRRLGYARIEPSVREGSAPPAFWVQEAGVPRRTFPVFVPPTGEASGAGPWSGSKPRGGRAAPSSRAIVVVGSDLAAEATWNRIASEGGAELDSEVRILVLGAAEQDRPHWHAMVVDRRTLLRLSTGVVVGMFRRAFASGGQTPVDFSELLEILRERFHLDVPGSLGVSSDEDALFLLYQLAQRDSYAPGDSASNLHSLVLKPTGPAARLPWFAG